MRRLLLIHLLFLWSCGSLSVRVEPSVKSSRDPELQAVPDQAFEDYARNQSEVLLDPEKNSESGSTDAYEVYRNGGRDFIRQLLRAVRDADLNGSQSWVMNEQQRTTWEGRHCVSLSPDQITRTGLPLPRMLTAIPLFGWDLTYLADPDWMRFVREENLQDGAPLLGEMHRLMLFEAGIRVRGSRLNTAEREYLEFTYKVVHEKGEPLSWLTRDGWGTRVILDLQRQDSKHQKLLIVTESGQDLYENAAAKIELRHELLIEWIDEGPRSRFHVQLMAHDQLQALSFLRDHEEGSLALQWQVDQHIRQFKLYPAETGLCHGT